MKNILLFFIFIVSTNITLAQNTIEGKIIDNNNKPLINVNIIVKGTSNGVKTDTNGNFTLNKISVNQTIICSHIGYKTKEITITKNKKNINIVLFEGNELLQEVTIESNRKNKFSRKETAYVSKLPLKYIENSQVYTTVTNEILTSQLTTNFEEALVNATGVDKRWESSGRVGTGATYYSIRGFSSQPALIDGVPGYTFTGADPTYIERIEVLKGPSATLFGSTVPSLGGLINIVTKKPFKGFGGSASYTTGSFGFHRASIDINTPIAKNTNTPYFRLNASYLTKDSFQDQGFKKNFYIAPSLTYQVSNRLNISLGIEYSKTEQTNPTFILLRKGYPLVSNTANDFKLDPNKSFTNNDITMENPIFNTRTIFDYKLSDNWTSQTILASSHIKSDGYYQYLFEGTGTLLLNPNPKTPREIGMNAYIKNTLKQNNLTRMFDLRDEAAATFNIQQNFIGDFKIGNVRNRMVVGFDYMNKTFTEHNKITNPTNGFPVIYGMFKPDGTPIDNFLTPTVVEKEYPLNRDFLDTIFNKITANDTTIKDQTFATYISDVINLSPELSVMLAARLDYFDKQGNTKIDGDEYTKLNISPKFGAVYQMVKNKVSLFGNFQTGFVNIDPVLDRLTGSYKILNPQKAVQYEFGLKSNFFKGKLNTNLSYYNITAKDRSIIDTEKVWTHTMVDEMVSKGFELELNANPIKNLHLRGALSYNDSEVTKAKGINLIGRRLEESGPELLYNFWGDYKFDTSSLLKNIGVGFGCNGASAYNTIDNKVSGKLELPSYTILNAGIYYDHSKFRVGIKANNISDITYYKGWASITAQAPRSFLGTIVYKF